MADLFTRLLCLVKVAVVSGRDENDICRQLLAPLESNDSLDHLTALAGSGAKVVHAGPGWNSPDAGDLTAEDKDEILRCLREALAEADFETVEVRGEQIIDRGSQITFCALGTEASPGDRSAWDPDHEKRLRLKSAFDDLTPDYSVRLSGLTSLDITRVGIDKSYGVRQLRENLGIALDEMLFVGASLFPAGNDHPVSELGVLTIQVTNPGETKRIIETMLACLCGIEEERPALSANDSVA
jgi:hydroxymethylpyrimidine pyrophosphatase-like HAD family hydrolase